MGETIDSSLAKWVLMGQIKEEDDDGGGIFRADRRVSSVGGVELQTHAMHSQHAPGGSKHHFGL